MPCSAQLIRLFRVLPGLGRGNDNTAILQLPLDVILLIGDYLCLHDMFLLSQTCRVFRNIMARDWEWEVLILSLRDELRFWAGLAYVFTKDWACPKCHRLHRFDSLDLPDQGLSCWPPSCGVDQSRGGFVEEGYRLQYHHIQLALKFTRRQKNLRYLAALMKTYKFIDESLTVPFTKSYTAQPEIINNRFMLREEWHISNFKCPLVSIINNPHFRIPVCPHLRIISGGLSFSHRCKTIFAQLSTQSRAITRLEDMIVSAMRTPGHWKFVSCPRCSTDCSMEISRDLKIIRIIAWHDFGPEGSPLDGGWKAHVETKSYTDWLAPWPV